MPSRRRSHKNCNALKHFRSSVFCQSTGIVIGGLIAVNFVQAQEQSALPLRLTTLQEEVEAAKAREVQLQAQFKEKMERLAYLRKAGGQ